MSALAKLMIPNRGGLASSRQPATNAAAASRALICGLWSYVGHVPRRGHQLAALATQRRLVAAVEEVRHVRVLLGLRDVQLRRARLLEHPRQRRRRVLRREHHRVGPVLLVARHRRVAATGGAPPRPAPAGQLLGWARSDSPKPGSASARVSSRIRSGLKLNAITLSPGRMRASSPTSVGSMNSSVSPLRYASWTACSPLSA